MQMLLREVLFLLQTCCSDPSPSLTDKKDTHFKDCASSAVAISIKSYVGEYSHVKDKGGLDY